MGWVSFLFPFCFEEARRATRERECEASGGREAGRVCNFFGEEEKRKKKKKTLVRTQTQQGLHYCSLSSLLPFLFSLSERERRTTTTKASSPSPALSKLCWLPSLLAADHPKNERSAACLPLRTQSAAALLLRGLSPPLPLLRPPALASCSPSLSPSPSTPSPSRPLLPPSPLIRSAGCSRNGDFLARLERREKKNAPENEREEKASCLLFSPIDRN